MTDSALVRLEVDGGIGTIRLDRPPMNALNVQVQEELRAAAHEAGGRSDVSAVVLYGGEKVFAAGADIKEMATMAYADMVARSGPLQTSFTAVARIPKPVVAAVTGYALGGGCELALCADFRVCGENAKLGQPEIQLGVIPGAGGTQRLPRLVGPARAKDIIFTGRFVGAEEALRIGLVDQVVPADEVYAAARAMAAAVRRRVRRSRCGPPRRRSTAAWRPTSTSGLELERLQFAGLFATDDGRVGHGVLRQRRSRQGQLHREMTRRSAHRHAGSGRAGGTG